MAVTGQAAPDSTGATDGTFNRFAGTPVLNDGGTAVFKFPLSGASGAFDTPEGIWTGGGGRPLTQIAREDDATSDGTIGSLLSDPVLNDLGEVGFQAMLNDTTGGFGVDDLAVFRVPGQGPG